MTSHTRFPFEFFTVTFAWSWLLWLPLVLAGAGLLPLKRDLVATLSTPVTIVAIFGPGLGALYCLKTRHGNGAVRAYLRGVLDFRLGWKAWLVPIATLGATTWLAWILPELWGAPRVNMLLPGLWAFPPYVLLMITLGGGQEELGWRGYILDQIEERLGPWRGNLVLGVVWAIWHLPLFFIPGANQTFVPFGAFVLLMVGYSWLFAWVRQASGRRTLAGLVAHGWANAFVPLFPTLVMAEGASQPRYWIWAGLTFGVGLIVMITRSRNQLRINRWASSQVRGVSVLEGE